MSKTLSLWLSVSSLASMLVCAGLCGCGGKTDARATPKETARRSLEAALTSWQNGQEAGEIQTVSPPVQVVDSVWANGRKLASYEIVGEESDEYGVRLFSVRLNLADPEASEEARYVVKGLSPVWVYRQEDHERSRAWKAYK